MSYICPKKCPGRVLLFVALSLAWNSQAAASDAAADEGATLDIIEVEAEWGDGRVTERDATAFCEYCLWGINQLAAEQGLDPLAGPAVMTRLQDFWTGVWEHVDLETKKLISLADVIWPNVQKRLDTEGPEYAETLTIEFAEFAQGVWGGLENETWAYLSGSLLADIYASMVEAEIAKQQAAARSVGGSISSFSPDSPNYRADLNTSYIVNDGSGDVMYIDE